MNNLYDEYLKFRNDYTSKINKRIKDVLPIINSSFVEYYGESYREIIDDRISNILFVYSLSDLVVYYICDYGINERTDKLVDFTKHILNILNIDATKEQILDDNYKTEIFNFLFGKLRVVNSNSNNLGILSFIDDYHDVFSDEEKKKFLVQVFGCCELNEDIINKLIECINYIKDIHEELRIIEKNFFEIIKLVEKVIYRYNKELFKVELNEDNFLKVGESKYIGCSDEEYMNFGIIRDIIYSNLVGEEDYNPFEINLPLDVNNLLSIVFLPIFIVNDEDFIHEINHAVRSSIFDLNKNYTSCDNEIINLLKEVVVKSGIEIGIDVKYRNTEELLCDVSAKGIYDIFKSKYSGCIFDDEFIRNKLKNVSSYKDRYIMVLDFYNKFRDIIDYASITNNINYLFDVVGKDNLDSLCDFVNRNYDNMHLSNDSLVELSNINEKMSNNYKKVMKKY